MKLLDFGLAKILSADADAGADAELVGTPLYMAPELWRREAASSRGDVYSLGAVLYELCTGRPPFVAASLSALLVQVQQGAYAPLSSAAPQVELRLAAAIERCLSKEPAGRFADAEELSEALSLITADEPAAEPGANPYRGLFPFESEHRPLFYGRGQEIAAVIELLRESPLVAVVGDSGVGKSSLCRAGVLPLFQEEAAADGISWELKTLVPGRHPGQALDELLAALGGSNTPLLLFIDQAEELATVSDAAEAAHCIRTLRTLAAGAGLVRILLTVRADCLARLSSLLGAANELGRGIFLLPPLGPSGLREVIVKPARRRGFTFESEELVEELVHTTLRTEGGLPLLSFALAELWESRDELQLKIPATALSAIGGVAGALARHAESVLAGLAPDERLAAKRILGRLVSVEGLRIERSEAELLRLGQAVRPALAALLAGRLLVTRNADERCTYEIAHEALVLGWSTLRSWLAEGRDARILLQRLEQSATEWERLGRDPDALWGRRQLADIAPLLASTGLDEAGELSEREQDFLRLSRRAERTRLIRRYALLLGGPLLALLLYAGASYRVHRAVAVRAGQQLSEAREALAQGHQLAARTRTLRELAFAAFDRGDRATGERDWSQVLLGNSALEQHYGRASRALELGQVLAPANADIHALFMTVLLERALLAEELRQPQPFEELRYRLQLYDSEGSRYRQLTAPAQLELRGIPRDATATLWTVRGDSTGRRNETEPHPLPAAPPPLTLPPGGYILSLTMPGRAPVRYPLQLSRGERLRLDVELPQAADVPAGMLFVPAGRFLYGSAADEGARRGFLRADPLHTALTSAYLIARSETTFADWISYLRTLDPQEHTQRLPGAGNRFQGSLSLSLLPGGVYSLSYQAGPRLYQVREGERLQYERRQRRAVQDWLRFPVTGISFEDAQAYASWLDRSGRVPGARLCTEREWERAARGADDRDYPHGDRLYPEDANYDETYGKEPAAFGPDEVGSHPASRSPFGADDMAGNALEWVTSTVAKQGCATRGGAYYYGELTSRLSNRTESEPKLRHTTQGFRICATYRPSGRQ